MAPRALLQKIYLALFCWVVVVASSSVALLAVEGSGPEASSLAEDGQDFASPRGLDERESDRDGAGADDAPLAVLSVRETHPCAPVEDAAPSRRHLAAKSVVSFSPRARAPPSFV